jgi:hypothetical protein
VPIKLLVEEVEEGSLSLCKKPRPDHDSSRSSTQFLRSRSKISSSARASKGRGSRS